MTEIDDHQDRLIATSMGRWKAYETGDLVAAESWWQTAADLGNPIAIDALAKRDAS